MWRVSTGVRHLVFDQIPNLTKLLYQPKYKPTVGGEGASDRKAVTPAAKSLQMSIFKKRQPLGFGVFIVIWSMISQISKVTSDPAMTSVVLREWKK